MTPKQIQRRRITLEKRADKILELRLQLMKTCPHPTPTAKYCGSSGNYDPSSDYYWIEWNCPDCGKYWTNDQSYENIRTYPNVIKI